MSSHPQSFQGLPQGARAYLVGGHVRDRLLGLDASDRDWVVTHCNAEDMLAAGFQPVGSDFPVFLHPHTHEEYALARTERKTGRGYHGFSVAAGKGVTLEEDLARRDLTINAMAQTAAGDIIDPWGGRQDLEKRLLRHVSPAFSEDPLRVLRVARFAARLAPLGFRVAEETLTLMRGMCEKGELADLAAERVASELRRALIEARPAVFIQTLHEVAGLTPWLAEVDRLFGIAQSPRHHPEIDSGVHTLLCLNAAAALGADEATRLAVLLHDLGKALTDPQQWPHHAGHESLGIESVKAVCNRLKLPKTHRELAVLVCAEHLNIHRSPALSAGDLLELLDRCDVWRRPDRFEQLLLACEADSRGREGFADTPYPQRAWLSELSRKVRSIQARDLLAGGVSKADVAPALRDARLRCIEACLESQPL